MSFRNTFITDFIYAGGPGLPEKMPAVTDAFNEHCSVVNSTINERGMGYYSGFIKTSSIDVNLADGYARIWCRNYLSD